MNNFQDKVPFIWDLADLLRGTYKRNEYQKVILPFTVLKRFDSVLADSKANVLKEHSKYKGQFDNLDLVLKSAAKDKNGRPLGFYNCSKYDFRTLLEDPEHIEQNLIHYIDNFSANVQDIFENFNIKSHISKLSKADLLFLLIKKFSETRVDLHPDKVSNHEMGTIFEELIRKFSEQSNEEAGDHFTPREVVRLMTQLMFVVNGNLKNKNIIKTIYDPACGTGGMLTSAENYIKEVNPKGTVVLYGQELNEEIYAICKADMLMRGEQSDNIKGPLSTLSNDKFPGMKFDYIISNPPYGTKWENDKSAVEEEAERGFTGRFGAGTPRINEGTLLFIQHMISKMKTNGEKSRIACITNGSPLFAGDAGSGESNIRKWIIDNDYIETIIALPDQMFYKTGINTYIWIMTNEKPQVRVGKIQLVNATSYYNKMKKSLGNKRHLLSDDDIKQITDLYSNFKENEHCKIFPKEEFGFTKVTVERPMRLNYCCSEERLENLYSLSDFKKLAESDRKKLEDKLAEEEQGKEKQREIMDALKSIGPEMYKSWPTFEKKVIAALKKLDLKPNFIKNIILALSEHDDTAEYVLDNKGKKQPDSNLRDTEKIKLGEDIDDYFKREVIPYYPDAWMDRSKDSIGYAINFTQYFYKYQPPRSLEEIEVDIQAVTKEILKLEKEEL